MRSTVLLLLVLLAPAALAAGPAALAAGPDLAQLRHDWPGYDAVIVDREIVFEMPSPELLRVTETTTTVILDGAAREHLAMFEVTRYPGCWEPTVHLETVRPDGRSIVVEHTELVPNLDADHPLDGAKGSLTLVSPRRGIEFGAVLTERVQVDYPASCHQGLMAASRRLGHPRLPILRERVSVRCEAQGCVAAVDYPDAAELVDGALVRTNVRPPKKEPRRQVGALRPRIYVSSSAEPAALPSLVAKGLSTASGPAGRVASSYRTEAKDAFPLERDPTRRLVRYLAQRVVVLGDRAFWRFGTDWGAPPKASARPLLPLEWLSVATASLGPAGGVPVLLSKGRGPLPPVGAVGVWGEVGVLLPEVGLVTPGRWYPFVEGSSASLAGRRLARLEADMVVDELLGAPASEQVRWTRTISPAAGGLTLIEERLQRTGRGAERTRQAWERAVQRWKDRPAKFRGSTAERDRTWVGVWLHNREIAHGEAAWPAPSRSDLTANRSETGQILRGAGLTTVVVDLPFTPAVSDLAGTGARESAVRLPVGTWTAELRVLPPKEHVLAVLPTSESFEAAGVLVEAAWTEEGGAAVLRFTYRVDVPLIPADRAAELTDLANLARRSLRSYVLFVAE